MPQIPKSSRVVLLAATAGALLVPSPASAATSCATSAKSYYGIKAAGTTCTTARAVARSWGTPDEFTATDQAGRRWRCKYTVALSPTASRAQCKRGDRVVGFKLRDTQ